LPPAEFIAPTIGIFVFKLVYSFGLYANRVNCSFRQSLGASLAGLALTYTVGRAVIYGLMTSRLPFMRTPKMDDRATLGMALGMARGEALLMGLLWVAALILWNTDGVIDPTARLWSFFMLVQSLPFTAAVVVSLVNALEQMRHAQVAFEPAPSTAAAAATNGLATAATSADAGDGWQSPAQSPVAGEVRPLVVPPPHKRTRHTNQLDYIMKEVVRSTLRHKHAWPFTNPVNSIKLNLPVNA